MKLELIEYNNGYSVILDRSFVGYIYMDKDLGNYVFKGCSTYTSWLMQKICEKLDELNEDSN